MQGSLDFPFGRRAKYNLGVVPGFSSRDSLIREPALARYPRRRQTPQEYPTGF